MGGANCRTSVKMGENHIDFLGELPDTIIWHLAKKEPNCDSHQQEEWTEAIHTGKPAAQLSDRHCIGAPIWEICHSPPTPQILPPTLPPTLNPIKSHVLIQESLKRPD